MVSENIKALGKTSSAKEEIFSYLNYCGISYHALEHKPIFTVQEGKLIAQQQGALCCKNLLLKSKKEFFLLLLPADKKLQSKELAKQIGSGHLSFASAEELEVLLHTYAGAVSVLGLIFDKTHRVRLLLDRDILKAPYIDCHPCTNDCSLKIATSDIFEIFLPMVGHEYQLIELSGQTS